MEEFVRAEAHYNATKSPEDAIRMAEAADEAIEGLQDQLRAARELLAEAEADREKFYGIARELHMALFEVARSRSLDEAKMHAREALRANEDLV